MVSLLIIADDFTGALDTGVQFSASGIPTKVLVGKHLQVQQEESCQVLVMDAETRHLSGEEAYRAVYHIVSTAKELGIPYVYKKTDSALRGNIGSELKAALDAFGNGVLPFFPAFPRMNRITRGGVHYIDGVPVSQSVFGKDPFEPVLHDRVVDIIHAGADVEADLASSFPPGEERGILVYDGESQEEMAEQAAGLVKEGKGGCLAGCAGMAALLPSLYGLLGQAPEKEPLPRKLVFLCGSVNPITQKQMAYAASLGYPRVTLRPSQKLEPAWWETKEARELVEEIVGLIQENDCCIVDGNDPPGRTDTLDYAREKGLSLEQLRNRITQTFGHLSRELLLRRPQAAYLITGGDTLMGLMREVGREELVPICEVAPGTVLTRLTWQGASYHLISKSGGFGDEDLICQILEKFQGQGKKEGGSCTKGGNKAGSKACSAAGNAAYSENENESYSEGGKAS